MMADAELKSLRKGDRLVVQLTGCVGEVVAEVVDEKGTDYHPGPWLREVGDTIGFNLKDGDFLAMRRA